jgi:hypothetical protein
MATKNNAETKEGGYRFVICDTHGHLIFVKAVYCSSVASLKGMKALSWMRLLRSGE